MKISGTKLLGGVLTLMIILTLAQPIALGQQDGLNGSWSGTWRTARSRGPLALHLTQDGEAVRGTYDTSGGPAGVLKGIRVTGTVKNSLLVLKTVSDPKIAFEGTVKGKTITGTFWARQHTKSFEVTSTGK